jgi:hypothetical protein
MHVNLPAHLGKMGLVHATGSAARKSPPRASALERDPPQIYLVIASVRPVEAPGHEGDPGGLEGFDGLGGQQRWPWESRSRKLWRNRSHRSGLFSGSPPLGTISGSPKR